jgi:hypothetical protein
MLGLICCPQYIGVDGFLSMNSFEPTSGRFCALALVLMLNGRPERFWWPILGLSAVLESQQTIDRFRRMVSRSTESDTEISCSLTPFDRAFNIM